MDVVTKKQINEKNLKKYWTHISGLRFSVKELIFIISNHLVSYATPKTVNYAWSFGSLAGITLVIQIISGLSLSTHYTPDSSMAFNSVEYIMRDVVDGWLIRYVHANGASMFFITVYAHLLRNLYYSSYLPPRTLVWYVGVIILVVLMGTAFTGYILPWGQMSFWAATVITNMVTVLPGGKYILIWLWGAETVSNPTLHRIFTLHYLLPAVLVSLSIIHLSLLHKVGSSDAIGSNQGTNNVFFFPHFLFKDQYPFFLYLLLFAILVFFYSNLLNHSDNCIKAIPTKTPAHVVPEWYFLPFYGILRVIPHKFFGIFFMALSILVLFALPSITSNKLKTTTFKLIFQLFFWLFLFDCIALCWIASQPTEEPFLFFGVLATVYYFFFFLVAIPVVSKIENFVILISTKK